ncbi:MAG: hypothetical protein HRU41_41170 [Saprospiraceae bacterium]|nr:hypothetical protein [Saprospiraceae bacterium]
MSEEKNQATTVDPPNGRMTIWEICNSKFGLTLLTSIVALVIMNFFIQWMENGKTFAAAQKQRAELFSELNHRIYLLKNQFTVTDQLSNKEEKVANIPELAAITSGQGIVFTEAGEGKRLVEIMAEYIKLDKGALVVGESIVQDLIRMQEDLERSVGLNADLQMARMNAARRKYIDFQKQFLKMQADKKERLEKLRRQKRMAFILLLVAAGSYPFYRFIQVLVERSRGKQMGQNEESFNLGTE